MIQPEYQEIPSEKIPVAKTSNNQQFFCQLGESLGSRAIIDTHVAVSILQPGSETAQLIPKSYNAFCYVIKGKGLFRKDRIEAEKGKAVIFKKDGEQATIASARSCKIST